MSAKQVLEEGSELMLHFEKRGGLLPVIVQEQHSGFILMLGYANQQALEQTMSSRLATFWSTSRQEIWTKGATSGDTLKIREILVDCDQDALIYQVEMLGEGVCHTKDRQHNARKTCFYRRVNMSTSTLEMLQEHK